MKTEKPNPGSSEAIKAGCTCPVMDNRNGNGVYTELDGTVVFVMTIGCPVHDKREDKP